MCNWQENRVLIDSEKSAQLTKLSYKHTRVVPNFRSYSKFPTLGDHQTMTAFGVKLRVTEIQIYPCVVLLRGHALDHDYLLKHSPVLFACWVGRAGHCSEWQTLNWNSVAQSDVRRVLTVITQSNKTLRCSTSQCWKYKDLPRNRLVVLFTPFYKKKVFRAFFFFRMYASLIKCHGLRRNFGNAHNEGGKE